MRNFFPVFIILVFGLVVVFIERANVNDEDTWKNAKDACPGFNPDCSFSEFVKQAKKEER